jgi:DNA-binding NtrC family response regulator
MDVPWEILVASSDLERRRSTVAILARLDLDPICASTVDQCREVLAKQNVRLVFCDRSLAGGSYRDVLVLIARKLAKSKPRLVLTFCVDGSTEYLEAKYCGAYEVIDTPCRPTDVEWMVIQARRDSFRRTLMRVEQGHMGNPFVEEKLR